MKDTIYRQSVIDEIAEYGSENTIYMSVAELKRRIEHLPSAQPEWIPCSERLPERNQICIVTDETRRCAYEYGLHDETYDTKNGWTYLGHKIIAWMPLPEPYKERRKE